MKKIHKKKAVRYTKKSGIRKDIPKNEIKNLRAIIAYERFSNRTHKVLNNTHTIKYRIKKLIEKQKPLSKELTVWRGQANCKIEPENWFSTSLKDKVASSYGGRCLFKIHLEPGVRCLDMYKYYDNYNISNPVEQKDNIKELMNNNKLNLSDDYSKFAEVIVQQGGIFWKDKEHTERGFKEIGESPFYNAFLKELNNSPKLTVYETYYSI